MNVVIDKAADLRATWSVRDERYARLKRSLSDFAVMSIRRSRADEAGYVEPQYRAALWSEAMNWNPPSVVVS